MKFPQQFFMLQILDSKGQWCDWQRIGQQGFRMGRSSKTTKQTSELNSMAHRHLQLSYDGKDLVVEDLGSLNGVYRKLVEPVVLEDGTRFRIGSHVIEFRRATTTPPAEPLVSEEGEQFWSRDLKPIAYLDFLGPDSSLGFSFPLLEAKERVVLGRENHPGRPVDVVLPYSEVSGTHAQIQRVGDRFLLEDLRSTNGTYVRFQGKTTLRHNDVIMAGRILLRVVSTGGMS